MNPPAHIDMGLIQQALARRMQSGQLGGGGMPAQQQVAGGGAVAPPPQVAPTGPLPMQQPQGQPAPQGQPQGPQQAQGPKPEPQFDDETKAVSKALIARLLKVI